MTRLTFLFLPLAALAVAAFAEPAPPVDAEVCVYGGTPAGVMAAVAAARLGHTVSLVDINAHTGGVVSGGLVATDMATARRRAGWRMNSSCASCATTGKNSATTRRN